MHDLVRELQRWEPSTPASAHRTVPPSTLLRGNRLRSSDFGEEAEMSYRNKTYVAFASENISSYRLMEAWRENKNIDFNFYDAHDLYVSRDTSKPETIKRNLRERMKNAKQVVLLGSSDAKKKGSDGRSFLAHEVDVMMEFDLPVVVANLDGDRNIDTNFIPSPLVDADYYTLSVSFQPAIIKFALDNYAANYSQSTNRGPHYYKAAIYTRLGI
jgi:hypothetical protein